MTLGPELLRTLVLRGNGKNPAPKYLHVKIGSSVNQCGSVNR